MLVLRDFIPNAAAPRFRDAVLIAVCADHAVGLPTAARWPADTLRGTTPAPRPGDTRAPIVVFAPACTLAQTHPDDGLHQPATPVR